MRLWSVHPRYFDRQALLACWREALLAQAVLAGQTRGYLRHPQIERFRAHVSPENAIGAFLCGIADEADARGYHFNRTKILAKGRNAEPIPVTQGQLVHEWGHLRVKLDLRSPLVAQAWTGVRMPEPHPLFTVTEGPVASWERLKDSHGGDSP